MLARLSAVWEGTMKTSTNRMLTTHVGSMARPPDLFEMLSAQATGRPHDRGAFAQRARSVISDAVRRQAEIGIDVVLRL